MNECETCGDDFKPVYRGQVDCRPCIGRESEHPLDRAEREDLEDRSQGLEEPWWRSP